jgi:solute carrier family 25 oxoglutarate transporter 11
MQVDAEGGGKRLYRSTSHAFLTIFRRGRFKSIYAGLSAGMLRQLSYGMPRFGLYTIFVGEANTRYAVDNSGSIPFGVKLGMGAAAGGLAACIGNPAEVALVRMAADSKAPKLQRRNYRNGLECLFRVAKYEGVGSLYSGVSATVVRAMLLNSCQLGIYSEAKEVRLLIAYIHTTITVALKSVWYFFFLLLLILSLLSLLSFPSPTYNQPHTCV